jgi:outer membrane murein-binding lipoprotein Lpp
MQKPRFFFLQAVALAALLVFSGCGQEAKDTGASSAEPLEAPFDPLLGVVAADSEYVLVLDIAELISAPLLAELVEFIQASATAGDTPAGQLESQLGLGLKDFGRLLVSIHISELPDPENPDQETPSPEGALALELNQPIDAGKFIEFLRALDADQTLAVAKEVELPTGKLLHWVPAGRVQPVAIALREAPARSIIIVGDLPQVEAAMRATSSSLPKGRRNPLKAASGHTLWLTLRPTPELIDGLSDLAAKNDQLSQQERQKEIEILASIEANSATLNVTDTLQFGTTLTLKDEDMAQQLEQSIRSSIEEQKQNNEPLTPMMPMTDLRESLQLQRTGRTLNITAQMSQTEAQQAKMLLGMLVGSLMAAPTQSP